LFYILIILECLLKLNSTEEKILHV
jgi:hypothetical protein